MLAFGVGQRLRVQLWKLRRLHETDLAEGYGSVQRAGGLRRKYRNADKQWNWQWVFPQHERWRDEPTGIQGGIDLIQAWAKGDSPRRDRGKDQEGRHVDNFPRFQWLRHAGLRPGSATH
jgi:hypothetical protein